MMEGPIKADSFLFPIRFGETIPRMALLPCKLAKAPYGIQLGHAIKQYCTDYARLDNANLRGAILTDAYIMNTSLEDADLTGADLRGSDMRNCCLRGACLHDADLRGARLAYTTLEGADVRGVKLDEMKGIPRIKNIHRAVYDAARECGALDMRHWHNGPTTHCRAGWVVHLAGDAGYEIEKLIGAPTAASLIYLASDPEIDRIPHFTGFKSVARADMKRCAEREAKRVASYGCM